MIENLNGEFETVEYGGKRCVKIHNNTEAAEYPVHWHNAVEIICAVENGVSVVCDGMTYALEENDIFIVPAGELHSLSTTPGRRLIMLCDNALFEGNPALWEISPAFSSPLFLNGGSAGGLLTSLGQCIRDMFDIYSGGGDMSDVYIYIKLMTFFSRIREYQLDAGGIAGGEKSRFRFVLSYIEKNYAREITLDELASLAGYSKYHFSRIFKRYCSTTYIDFLNRRRIRAAELLLLDDDLPITGVAMRSGFSSLSTFNRIFRSVKKCTPSEFRKLYRSSDTVEKALTKL